MRRVKGLVQLFVALALVALVVWTNVKPREGQSIEDAVYVEDAQVLPENEGKRVIVAGAVEVVAGAADEQVGISFASPVVRRSVEELVYSDEWVWRGVSSWSTGGGLTDATLVGGVRLGGFELDEHLATTLPIHMRDWSESDFDDETLSRLYDRWYWLDDGAEWYISQVSVTPTGEYSPIDADKVGSLRVRYDVWRDDASREVTLVGVQRGTTLCYDEDLDAACAFEGILDKDEVISSNSFGVLMGELIFAAIPVVLLSVFGVRNLLDL